LYLSLFIFGMPCQCAPAILLLAASGMSDKKWQEIIPALELKCPEEGAQSVVKFR
jgi:hypothetical protein